MSDPFRSPSGSAPDGTVANNIFKGGAAPTAGDSSVPEVHIEIQEIIGSDLRRQHVADDTTAMVINQTVGLGAQVVGAVMAVALGSSAWKWPFYLVELFVIIGMTLTYAAIALRHRRPDYMSVVMAKIGAIATAAAIITSAASHLPPPLAFTVTPFAVLVVLVAVVYA